jgi:hypothetical protein
MAEGTTQKADLLGLAGRPATETPEPPEETFARRIYNGNKADDRTQFSAIKQRGEDLWLKGGMNSAARRDLNDSFRTIQEATKLPDEAIDAVIDGHINNLMAAAQVTEDADDRETARRSQAWAIETRSKLSATYGDEAEALLERAQRFARAHPKLAEVLGRRGLGSRPDIVLSLVEHVRNVNFR